MTRINCIDPSILLDQHLIAEWRELPRIPNSIISGRARIENIPTEYTLGVGHVKFFYNKLKYLKQRHANLCKELDKRGIKRDLSVRVDIGDDSNDWKPTSKDVEINIERILQRFNQRKAGYTYRWYGKPITELGAYLVIVGDKDEVI